MKVSTRLPSLDGIRALAIALAMLYHLCGTHGVPWPVAEWIYRLGDLGVKTFFVLSVFLVITLLQAEQPFPRLRDRLLPAPSTARPLAVHGEA